MNSDSILKGKYMKKPSTYLDRIDKSNSKYVFISYSHVDIQKVYPLLSDLFNLGINFWYDKDISAGDVWNEKVADIILDDCCVGAIIFLSSKSVFSKSIYEEIKKILTKNQQFKIIPIIIDDVYCNWTVLLNYASRKDQNFYIERESEFKNLFKNGYRVFLNNDDDIIKELVKIAENNDFLSHSVINIRNSHLDKIGLISMGGEYYLKLGKFKSDNSIIEWKLVSQNNSYYYFVSQYCVDFVTNDKIDIIIKSIEMPQSAKQYVKELSVINEEFLEEYKFIIPDAVPTDYADQNRKQLLKLYWVKESELKKRNGYCLYNSVNKKINKNINIYSITAGIRVLLIIDDKKIMEG